ncbi:serine/threonine-protein kinase [Mycolicibacterium holsaticum]|uniref:non-specific serine/threonine protein kinase n=1 Tax=Mycolicibacterium holsaticum TaxID=152142 RepID=A0A1E3S067_9MYCO|nr:serine/threonine-protein kinase [Mycolicibacterium holsaticum]ODQ94977.1 protein kinase [Mycolicibacterium holsaticum]
MSSPKGSSRLGTRFGSYELQSVIGVGGMGEVYRAYDTARDRMVAIKLLRSDLASDPTFQERFRRESRVAARLQEPHVIPVHDFGEIDGVLYIDMRLVEGASLKEVLRDGALPPARAVSIITQVASALDAAHASGLVHRDIKPENVLLTPEDFAYLVDFGIAHGSGEATVTMTGLLIGSSAYMAPERFNGERGGPASDVYSLSCLLYEALTGRAPFEAADLRQVISAHLFNPPPRPSIMRRGISRAFDDVVARGMAKKPADRYASAGELAKAAGAALDQPLSAAPPPAPAPPPPRRQFPAGFPNPVATGYPPYAPPPPARSAGTSRFSRGQLALLVATIVMFTAAVVLAAVLVFDGGDASQPQTKLAVPPTEPTSAATTTTTTTTTTPTTTTPRPSGAPIAGVSGTDSLGFVGHSARCDAGDAPEAAIRTSNSLAVVCETAPGNYYYRGERLRDGASLELSNAVPSGAGFVAINPADGARYEVRPDVLTISSSRGVDSAEPALEFGAG